MLHKDGTIKENTVLVIIEMVISFLQYVGFSWQARNLQCNKIFDFNSKQTGWVSQTL